MTAPTVASRADAASHLSPVALSMLRALLLCELVTQLAQADEHQQILAQLAEEPDADLLERELAEVSASRTIEAIACIRQALDRLDSGTYGRCQRCFAAIPLERLEVIPHALLCVACSGRARGLLR